MKNRYVIEVLYKGESRGYVTMFSQGKGWDSGARPKVFKTFDSVDKCKRGIKKYATAVELKTMRIVEED